MRYPARNVSPRSLSARLVALAAVLLAGVAVAQNAQPVDPVGADNGMVRFLNLAPNATPVTLALSNDDGAVVALTEFESLAYGAQTAYIPVPAGGYDMTITVGDSSTQLPAGYTAPYVVSAPNRLDVGDGGYYTVAVLGLLVPENFDDTSDDGFLGWLRDLFGGDTPADRDALALRVEVLDDDVYADFGADEARVRVVHAAPGAAAVDLVSTSDRGVVASGIAFDEVSGYHTLATGELGLTLRGADSDVELADLSSYMLEPGRNHTVFLIGTPFEGVPLEALVLSDAPVAAP